MPVAIDFAPQPDKAVIAEEQGKVLEYQFYTFLYPTSDAFRIIITLIP
jgi:hypothetical protein